MNIKQLKLKIVQQIMDTENLELLKTVRALLSLDDSEQAPLNEILPEVPSGESKHTPDDLHEIQGDIDEIFSPK